MANPYYITHSGARVRPDDLDGLELGLEDIAHHLTNIQRFGGALPLDKSYSVAHHSILMATYAMKHHDKIVARECLLHDATEAYLGDVVSPLKAGLKDYQVLENKLCERVYKKYNIGGDERVTALVKMLDSRILLDEVKTFIPNQLSLFIELNSQLSPLDIMIDDNLSKHEVKDAFLYWAEYLNIRD